MAKKKKSITIPSKKVSFVKAIDAGKEILQSKKNLRKFKDSKVPIPHKFKMQVNKNLKDSKKELKKEIKGAVRTASGNVSKKFSKFSKEKFVNKKVMRSQPRATLDLRQRPEREVPVKQHGFKAEEIGNNNFLFN